MTRILMVVVLVGSVVAGCSGTAAAVDGGSERSDAGGASGDAGTDGGGQPDASLVDAGHQPDASFADAGDRLDASVPDAGDGDGGACPVLIEGKAPVAPPAGVPRPALGVPYVDSRFGLSIARVTAASQVTDRDFPAWVRHEYSRRPAFNADASRALMISSNGWLRLYDVRPDGSLVFLKTLNLGEPQEPNWHPTDPRLLYFFVGYGGGFTISTYDVVTDQTAVVADLGTRVRALFPGATGMWTKQEGRPSDDGRVWCLEVGHTGAGAAFIADGLIAYDLQADQLLGHLAVTESPDHISTSPAGNYCVPSWGLPKGTRAYRTDFSSFVQLHDRSEHSDLATTRQGEEVLVYTAYDGANSGNVVMVRLSDGAATALFELYGPNHSATAMHLSGTAKARPGYIVVGFYGCSENYGAAPCDPASQWFVDKVVAVELAPNPKIFSLAHTHYGNAGYFAETQPVASADLTKVLFVSTWESTAESDVASYLVQVPRCALP